MSVVIGKKSFNKVWAASVSKSEFVKHFTNLEAFKDVDLASEYDKIVPPKSGKSDDKK